VAQLYHQALGYLSIASYDSQGCGGGTMEYTILTKLRRTQQKLQFIATVMTSPVLLRLCFTMEMKSTSRCIATDICRISFMWEVPTASLFLICDRESIFKQNLGTRARTIYMFKQTMFLIVLAFGNIAVLIRSIYFSYVLLLL
jgi:hypothetical protein